MSNQEHEMNTSSEADTQPIPQPIPLWRKVLYRYVMQAFLLICALTYFTLENMKENVRINSLEKTAIHANLSLGRMKDFLQESEVMQEYEDYQG